MVIILKSDPGTAQVSSLRKFLEKNGLQTHLSEGKNQTVIGLVGDTSRVDMEMLKALDIVEDVKRIQEPYKDANRKFHPDDTIVQVGDAKFGGGFFSVIAGPCSVESEEQIITVAEAVKASGAALLRGGAFKPRTSPYAFQGLRDEGIRLLLKAKKVTGLPIVTEIMDLSQLELFDEVDVIQIGARNMQNFELLRQIGRQRKPVLLKRGLANTYQEWLMSAEYIMSSGNSQVILCERGVRTFEPQTRNTLDISAIPVVKSLSHLPIIVDPSHSIGVARYVPPLAMAAVGAGADGLIVEVHNDPACALCDGAQSLTPANFDMMMKKVNTLRSALQ